MNKRGLSDIVTNVLIILLVLVAVGIIWAFVRPTIQQGSEELEGAADCYNLQLEATCSLRTGLGNLLSTGNMVQPNTVVKVQRGTGTAQLNGLVYAFSDGSRTVLTNDTTMASYFTLMHPGFEGAAKAPVQLGSAIAVLSQGLEDNSLVEVGTGQLVSSEVSIAAVVGNRGKLCPAVTIACKPTTCMADINLDGAVNVQDRNLWTSWGTSNSQGAFNPLSDLNGDGFSEPGPGSADDEVFMSHYNVGC